MRKHLPIPFQQRLNDVGLLLIRLVIGWVFVYHGAQKLFGAFGGSGIDGFAANLEGMGFPFPTLNAYLAGGTEFFGGVMLMLGLLTRVAAVPLIFTMLVASFVVHGQAFGLQNNGMEYALTLAVVTTGLLLMGPGRYNVLAPWTCPYCVKDGEAPATDTAKSGTDETKQAAST